jgi:hypothetical protein
MEEDFVAAVVGLDEAEALVLDYLLDRAKHRLLSSRFACVEVPQVEVMRREPYGKLQNTASYEWIK